MGGDGDVGRWIGESMFLGGGTKPKVSQETHMRNSTQLKINLDQGSVKNVVQRYLQHHYASSNSHFFENHEE